MCLKYFYLLSLILNYHLIICVGECGGGWDVYHDEYYDICYKYIPERLGDYQTVATACRGEMDSTLPTINSQAEQDFLNSMIVKYKMVESVWLGAGIKNKHIVWSDSSSGEYENWVRGSPVNDSNCVEMVPEQANVGKWQDQPCTKKNAFLCKRVVMWSAQRTERLIRDNRRLLDELKQNQDKHHSQIIQLENSQVPVGFIYVQLPDQAEPKTLWPKYTWSDVTEKHAGNFFRAEGGGSLSFGGGVQSGNAPRLSNVNNMEGNCGLGFEQAINPGVWSESIWTGLGTRYSPSDWFCIMTTFKETDGEVRPKNEAVRLYKRVQ